MSTLNVGTIKSLGSSAPVFQNSSGVEKGQLAKAWVRFNGTGTVSITDSFNISSLTDVGTGTYAFDFTNNMANTNYAVLTSTVEDSDAGSDSTFYATTGFRCFCTDDGSFIDRELVACVVFGD